MNTMIIILLVISYFIIPFIINFIYILIGILQYKIEKKEITSKYALSRLPEYMAENYYFFDVDSLNDLEETDFLIVLFWPIALVLKLSYSIFISFSKITAFFLSKIINFKIEKAKQNLLYEDLTKELQIALKSGSEEKIALVLDKMKEKQLHEINK